MRAASPTHGSPTQGKRATIGRGALFAAALGALVLGFAATALAANAESQTASSRRALGLRYDIYVGGFYVFGFDATVGLEGDAYTVALEGGTAGFIGRLFPWRAWMTSEGGVASVDPAPTGLMSARFDNVAEWHHKAKRVSVRFERGGGYAIEHDPPEPPSDHADDDGGLPSVLPPGTMDPVAAAVAALGASARDGACERRVPVFDGKRRYDLLVRPGDGETVLKRSHLSAYSGPALSCRIAIDPISGFSKKKRYVQWDSAGGTDNRATIWAARVAPDMPLVPVRFLATVNIGGNASTVIVHLVHAEVRDGNGRRVLADLSSR